MTPAQVENRMPLTVAGLIEQLGKFPQDLLVVQKGGAGWGGDPSFVISPMIQRCWVDPRDDEIRVLNTSASAPVGTVDEDYGTLKEVVWL